MSYYYLFCNEDRRPLARIRYTFSPDNALVIEDMVPAGAVTIDKVMELELRRNAAQLDKDSAEADTGSHLDTKHESTPETQRIADWSAHRPIRWGVKG